MKNKIKCPTEVEETKTEENKDEFITIDCSVEEYEAIKAAAEEANLSISEYLIRESKKHSEMLSLIDKVSNNDTHLDKEIDEMRRKFDDPQHDINENDFNEFVSLSERTAKKRSNITNDLQDIIKIKFCVYA